MVRGTAAALALVAIAGGSASAEIDAIDPFKGEAWEFFENLFPPGGYPGEMTILGGAATINDSLANMMMIATSLYSFLTDQDIFPYNGNLMGGFVSGWGVIEFDTPVLDFGAYIGTADILEGGSFVFRGEEGDVIGSAELTVGPGEWAWFGWSSDIPIWRVEIYGGETPSAPIVIDDIQVNFVPTPGAAALFGLAGVGAIRRRRR